MGKYEQTSRIASLIAMTVICILVAVLLFGFGWFLSTSSFRVPEQTPTPSYFQETQQKNLELLQAAQLADLVTCRVNETVRLAILIEQNDGQQLIGREIDKNFINNKQTFPYRAFTGCNIEIRRDDTNGVMPHLPATIGRIILYGLNPPPVK